MKKWLTLIIVLLLGGAVMFGCSGCRAQKYVVDYCGQMDSYQGAKKQYRAGAQVKLYYPYIATDTDYAFYLDDERLNTDYSEKRGFILTFTMPAHDVTLRCEHHNSMVYMPDGE